MYVSARLPRQPARRFRFWQVCCSPLRHLSRWRNRPIAKYTNIANYQSWPCTHTSMSKTRLDLFRKTDHENNILKHEIHRPKNG